MFIASGVGPYSGQAVHFRTAAPEPREYALNRYDFEAHRHWGILNDRLASRQWLVGNEYSIVDMAFWGWARMVPYVLGTGDATWSKYPNVKRLLDTINARPAAQRAEMLLQLPDHTPLLQLVDLDHAGQELERVARVARLVELHRPGGVPAGGEIAGRRDRV